MLLLLCMQVLYHANANLSACREFMKVMQEQRMRPQAVPVLVQEGKNGITLTLSPDYYEQVRHCAALCSRALTALAVGNTAWTATAALLMGFLIWTAAAFADVQAVAL